MPIRASVDEEIRAPDWWDDAEYFVTILPKVRGQIDGEPVEYEPGEGYPHPDDETRDDVTAEAWARSPWVSTKLAALDENFERLDTPSNRERVDEDVNATAALEAFRRRHGVKFERVVERVYTCEDCGAEFDTADALNGHQGKHAREAAAAADEGGTAADATDDTRDGDDADETAEETDETGPAPVRGDDLLEGQP